MNLDSSTFYAKGRAPERKRGAGGGDVTTPKRKRASKPRSSTPYVTPLERLVALSGHDFAFFARKLCEKREPKALQNAEAHIGELQVNSLDMLQAKELGLPDHKNAYKGHKLFEIARKIGKDGEAIYQPHLQHALDMTNRVSRELYSEARARMMKRDRTFKSLSLAPSLSFHKIMNQSLSEAPNSESPNETSQNNTEFAKSLVRAHFRHAKGQGVHKNHVGANSAGTARHGASPAKPTVSRTVGDARPQGAPALPPIQKWGSANASQMFRPGYYSHHGFLTVVTEPGAHPVAWYPHKSQWKHIEDVPEFLRDASRCSVSEARELQGIEKAPFLPQVQGATGEDLQEHLEAKQAAHAGWWRENHGHKS